MHVQGKCSYRLRVATSAAIGPKVDRSEAVLPLWLGKYPLNRESVHIHQAYLKQVQGGHQNLLALGDRQSSACSAPAVLYVGLVIKGSSKLTLHTSLRRCRGATPHRISPRQSLGSYVCDIFSHWTTCGRIQANWLTYLACSATRHST